MNILNKEFLKQLDLQSNKTIYIKIIKLDNNENPIEEIQGISNSGSINIDGKSNLRRTCNLSLLAIPALNKNLNYQRIDLSSNNFIWALKTKIKIEVGVDNNIDNNYPKIIWFNQGIFVLTSFSYSLSNKGITINLSGKDKMCLLNGEQGGVLQGISNDFGTEQYIDQDDDIYIIKIPIYKIIRESIHNYANEPYENIIINDLDDEAVELLEYKGDSPLYLIQDSTTNAYINYTIDGDQVCYKLPSGIETRLDQLEYLNKYPVFNQEFSPDNIVFDLEEKSGYNITKIEYGQTIGYRATDLVYAGDLILNAGEPLTAMLDKITKMLGNYEYFYNLNGQFVFQKKKTYIDNTWTKISIDKEDLNGFIVNPNSSGIAYRFLDNKQVINFSNSINLNNIHNDFVIWGVNDGGANIHYHFSVNKKPSKYTSILISKEDIEDFNKNCLPGHQKKIQYPTTYTIEENDWREIIYRMAEDFYKYGELDNFQNKVKKSNPEMVNGKTGYEYYYLDIYSNWRDLYLPLEEYKEKKSECDLLEDQYALLKTLKELKNYHGLIKQNTDDKDSMLNKIKQHNKEYYDKKECLISTIQVMLGIKDKDTQFTKSSMFINRNIQTLLARIFYLNRMAFLLKNDFIILSKDANCDEKALNFLALSQTYYNTRLEYKEEDAEQIMQQLQELYLDTDMVSQILDNLNQNISLIENFESQLNKKVDLIKNIFDQVLNKITEEEEKDSQELDNLKNEIDRRKEFLSQYINSPLDDKKNIEGPKWNRNVFEDASKLTYWFEMINHENFSIDMIGYRNKVVKNDQIKRLFDQETPLILFTDVSGFKKSRLYSGYDILLTQGNLDDLFVISGQGKTAKMEIDELLYENLYCQQQISFNAIPVYYLEPNTRIEILDPETKINDEFIVEKISIPLSANGTMNINASKAIDRKMI